MRDQNLTHLGEKSLVISTFFLVKNIIISHTNTVIFLGYKIL